MSKVLIADDEEEAVEVLSDFLTDIGYQTKTASDGEEAIACLKSEKYDILILDLRMPRIDGEGVMQVLSEHSPQTAVIITTGYSDGGETKERIQQYNVAHYMEKPIDLDILEKVIKDIEKKKQ
ncbi:MAG: response regulator [Candidatus Omnitrophica bacterium]|nr:response regulator [Candidatus Omnitrophota bacterium]